MNVRLAVLVASLSVAIGPALALAEEPPVAQAVPGAAVSGSGAATVTAAAPASGRSPDAEARRSARWSFGGGLAYTVVTYPTGTLGGLLGPAVLAPQAGASLERRLAPRSWLVFGLSGTFQRDRQDVPPGSSGYARNDARSLTASAGLRRSLTRASAPVEVSLVVLADGGVLDADFRSESRYDPAAPIETRRETTSWFAGGQLGIALDRELTDGLVLRVASPLVGARYTHATTRSPGQPAAESSSVVASALLAPRLELRLLF